MPPRADTAGRKGGAPPHLLHLFATFTTGGPQMRTATILNRLGGEFRHTIVAMDNNFGAREKVEAAVDCRFTPPPPRQSSLRYAVALRRFVRANAPDLALTYNWGAMDAFVGSATIPGLPVIHGEDGFGPEEAERLLRRRVWTRRLWLRRARRVVVPSRLLYRIAREQYRLPEPLVEFIANGVDTARFAPGRNDALRSELGIPGDAVVFGFVGRLGPEKNLGLLLRAFDLAGDPSARLVIVGEGQCETEWKRLAGELGLGARILFAGPTAATEQFYRAFDVFAMSSATEQAPISLLEAMACGLPALSTAVGDIDEMLGRPGPDAIVAPGGVDAYAAALRRLAADGGLRARLGAANRKRCVEFYSLDTMIDNYRQLYLSATGAAHAH